MKTITDKLQILYILVLLLQPLPIFGQTEAPTLVVRIDDLGAFHSVNKACIETYRSGIAQSVEVMPVAAWFPEAVKMLRENPGLDVGIHLAITSEWENVKWRPLTHCPSLTDENGYFYPMMSPNPAYPGQAVTERKWNLQEIEQEFRAQIELALKNIPQVSHLSGHMLSTGFDAEVNRMVLRLAREYNLPSIDRFDSQSDYGFTYIGYDGPSRTSAEKEESFIKMLQKLEPGKRYLFLDHPAYNDDEMSTVFHIGYENVAEDRQGVTDVLTSDRVKQVIAERGIKLQTINALTKSLPRAVPSKKFGKALNAYLKAVDKSEQDLHSIMVVQHGRVIGEQLQGNHVKYRRKITIILWKSNDVCSLVRLHLDASISKYVKLSATSAHFLHVRLELFQKTIIRRDRHDRHFFVDKRKWAVLQFPCRISFSMDVANFFKLKRPFKRNWVMQPASEEKRMLSCSKTLSPVHDLRFER